MKKLVCFIALTILTNVCALAGDKDDKDDKDRLDEYYHDKDYCGSYPAVPEPSTYAAAAFISAATVFIFVKNKKKSQSLND